MNHPIQPIPPVLTMAEVAELLRCPESTVGRYVRNHELRAIRIGRERRFRGDDVLDFIAARPTTGDNGRKRQPRGAPR